MKDLKIGNWATVPDFPSLGIGQITKIPDLIDELYGIIFLQDPKLIHQKEFDNEYYIEFTDEYYFYACEFQKY